MFYKWNILLVLLNWFPQKLYVFGYNHWIFCTMNNQCLCCDILHHIFTDIAVVLFVQSYHSVNPFRPDFRKIFNTVNLFHRCTHFSWPCRNISITFFLYGTRKKICEPQTEVMTMQIFVYENSLNCVWKLWWCCCFRHWNAVGHWHQRMWLITDCIRLRTFIDCNIFGNKICIWSPNNQFIDGFIEFCGHN